MRIVCKDAIDVRLLEYDDLIVQAKSGTGKTCVFTVIALESLQLQSGATQVLVLAPTREIAVQIWEVMKSVSSKMVGVVCHMFIGGLPVHEDKLKLKKCHIAIGTPGRIKQLIENDLLKTDSVRLFVLDEADKLLEDGFQEQINWIYWSLPENKQMLALSATYPEYMARHLTIYMRNPTFVRLNSDDPALLGIKQYYMIAPFSPFRHKVFEEKTKVLIELLSSVSFHQCLIFSNLQTRAQTLCDLLNKQGWPSECIAGCLEQEQRLAAMEKLKTFKCRILISTDLTSRGIDAERVNMVVNLDLPYEHETYLHRIGRAGRFGSFGAAVTLVSGREEMSNLKSVEEKCHTCISPLPVPIPSDLVDREVNIDLSRVVSTEQLITRKGEITSRTGESENHMDRGNNLASVHEDVMNGYTDIVTNKIEVPRCENEVQKTDGSKEITVPLTESCSVEVEISDLTVVKPDEKISSSSESIAAGQKKLGEVICDQTDGAQKNYIRNGMVDTSEHRDCMVNNVRIMEAQEKQINSNSAKAVEKSQLLEKTLVSESCPRILTTDVSTLNSDLGARKVETTNSAKNTRGEETITECQTDLVEKDNNTLPNKVQENLQTLTMSSDSHKQDETMLQSGLFAVNDDKWMKMSQNGHEKNKSKMSNRRGTRRNKEKATVLEEKFGGGDVFEICNMEVVLLERPVTSKKTKPVQPKIPTVVPSTFAATAIVVPPTFTATTTTTVNRDPRQIEIMKAPSGISTNNSTIDAIVSPPNVTDLGLTAPATEKTLNRKANQQSSPGPDSGSGFAIGRSDRKVKVAVRRRSGKQSSQVERTNPLTMLSKNIEHFSTSTGDNIPEDNVSGTVMPGGSQKPLSNVNPECREKETSGDNIIQDIFSGSVITKDVPKCTATTVDNMPEDSLSRSVAEGLETSGTTEKQLTGDIIPKDQVRGLVMPKPFLKFPPNESVYHTYSVALEDYEHFLENWDEEKGATKKDEWFATVMQKIEEKCTMPDESKVSLENVRTVLKEMAEKYYIHNIDGSRRQKNEESRRRGDSSSRPQPTKVDSGIDVSKAFENLCLKSVGEGELTGTSEGYLFSTDQNFTSRSTLNRVHEKREKELVEGIHHAANSAKLSKYMEPVIDMFDKDPLQWSTICENVANIGTSKMKKTRARIENVDSTLTFTQEKLPEDVGNTQRSHCLENLSSMGEHFTKISDMGKNMSACSSTNSGNTDTKFEHLKKGKLQESTSKVKTGKHEAGSPQRRKRTESHPERKIGRTESNVKENVQSSLEEAKSLVKPSKMRANDQNPDSVLTVREIQRNQSRSQVEESIDVACNEAKYTKTTALSPHDYRIHKSSDLSANGTDDSDSLGVTSEDSSSSTDSSSDSSSHSHSSDDEDSYPNARDPAPNSRRHKGYEGSWEQGLKIYNSGDLADGTEVYTDPYTQENGYAVGGNPHNHGSRYQQDGRYNMGYWEQGREFGDCADKNVVNPATSTQENDNTVRGKSRNHGNCWYQQGDHHQSGYPHQWQQAAYDNTKYGYSDFRSYPFVPLYHQYSTYLSPWQRYGYPPWFMYNQPHGSYPPYTKLPQAYPPFTNQENSDSKMKDLLKYQFDYLKYMTKK